MTWVWAAKRKQRNASKRRFTSRLRICLSRSVNWFLRAWISAVAGFNLGSRARITYKKRGGGIVFNLFDCFPKIRWNTTTKTTKSKVFLLTSRAFSRYILYLSSIALMSSSFFFRAAISSSTFKASERESEREKKVSPLSHFGVSLFSLLPKFGRSRVGAVIVSYRLNQNDHRRHTNMSECCQAEGPPAALSSSWFHPGPRSAGPCGHKSLLIAPSTGEQGLSF